MHLFTEYSIIQSQFCDIIQSDIALHSKVHNFFLFNVVSFQAKQMEVGQK